MLRDTMLGSESGRSKSLVRIPAPPIVPGLNDGGWSEADAGGRPGLGGSAASPWPLPPRTIRVAPLDFGLEVDLAIDLDLDLDIETETEFAPAPDLRAGLPARRGMLPWASGDEVSRLAEA